MSFSLNHDLTRNLIILHPHFCSPSPSPFPTRTPSLSWSTMFFKHLQIFLSLSAVVASHFVLQVPLSLGFNDTNEIISPCDSFDPLDRSGGVTDWPVAGSSIVVLTTHLDVVWEFKAALLSDVAAGAPIWRPITLQLSQQGVGTFCEPQIPGPLEWVGLDAVLQIVQHAPDGLLYQVYISRFSKFNFTLSKGGEVVDIC